MSENFFSKTSIRKCGLSSDDSSKKSGWMVFSRIPIEADPVENDEGSSDAVKRIDAALGLLKLRSSDKQTKKDTLEQKRIR